jgi:hypothetical protein
MSPKPKIRSPKITTEQALEILKRHEPEFAQFKVKKDQDLLRAAAEIDMLERRITEQVEYLTLPGGDSIAVRTCFTETEETELVALMNKTGTGDRGARNEFLAKIIHNPIITAAWLSEHPDKLAIQDLLDVMYGWLEIRKQKREELAQRLMDLASFRGQ